MSNRVQNLLAAKSLISDPKNWIQGTYARNQFDQRVGADHPEACKFCSLGALDRVIGTVPKADRKEYKVLDLAFRRFGFGHTMNGNDRLSHPEVMKVWDNAIELMIQYEVHYAEKG